MSRQSCFVRPIRASALLPLWHRRRRLPRRRVRTPPGDPYARPASRHARSRQPGWRSRSRRGCSSASSCPGLPCPRCATRHPIARSTPCSRAEGAHPLARALVRELAAGGGELTRRAGSALDEFAAGTPEAIVRGCAKACAGLIRGAGSSDGSDELRGGQAVRTGPEERFAVEREETEVRQSTHRRGPRGVSWRSAISPRSDPPGPACGRCARPRRPASNPRARHRSGRPVLPAARRLLQTRTNTWRPTIVISSSAGCSRPASSGTPRRSSVSAGARGVRPGQARGSCRPAPPWRRPGTPAGRGSEDAAGSRARTVAAGGREKEQCLFPEARTGPQRRDEPTVHQDVGNSVLDHEEGSPHVRVVLTHYLGAGRYTHGDQGCGGTLERVHAQRPK